MGFKLNKKRALIGGTLIASALALWYFNTQTTNLSRHLTSDERRAAKADVRGLDLDGREWDEFGFIKKYQNVIREEAARNFIPPSLIAAIIYEEQIERGKLSDLEDSFKAGIRGDVSLGAGQIKLSTALYLDGIITSLKPSEFGKVDDATKDKYITRLNDPEKNIHYIAAYLRSLADSRYRGNPSVFTDRGSMQVANMYRGGAEAAYREGWHGSKVVETMHRAWVQELFPLQKPKERVSSLDYVVDELEAKNIKQTIGEALTTSRIGNNKVAYLKLEEAAQHAEAEANEREWGKGKEYYYGLGVVTLMYQAKILLESDPRTAMDTKHASEKYNAALQIRQLMDVRSGDIVMPDYVDDPVSGNKIPIATTSFIRGKLID